jgi:hypothetical protein
VTHYNRSEWGGRAPEARYRLDPLRVEGVALHWPGITKPIHAVPDVMAALRSWQRMHMDTNGWSDIAYQIAVDQAGNTYGLRGLRYRSGANGDADVNLRFGAFLLVVATRETPTPALIKTVRARVTAHRNLFPSSRRIVGHRDIRPEPTACPGDLVGDLIVADAFGNHNGRK